MYIGVVWVISIRLRDASSIRVAARPSFFKLLFGAGLTATLTPLQQ